jgi:hypothetical protein
VRERSERDRLPAPARRLLLSVVPQSIVNPYPG